MKALSIKQPWAWLIVNGYKDIENRSWNTNFRGEFLIHASKQIPTEFEYVNIKTYLVEMPDSHQKNYFGTKDKSRTDFEYGGIVGIAELVDVLSLDNNVYHPDIFKNNPWWERNCYGFVLRNARPLQFIPYKGKLGFFDIPIHLDINKNLS